MMHSLKVSAVSTSRMQRGEKGRFGWSCSSCSCFIEAASSHHCNFCSFDRCSSCHEKLESIELSQMVHTLRSSVLHADLPLSVTMMVPEINLKKEFRALPVLITVQPILAMRDLQEAELKLEFQGNSFFNRCTFLCPIPSLKIAHLLVCCGACADDFPLTLKCEVHVNKRSWSLSFAFCSSMFSSQFDSDVTINVVPFGPPGCGKSSLMNTLATSLSKSPGLSCLFPLTKRSPDVKRVALRDWLSRQGDGHNYDNLGSLVFWDANGKTEASMLRDILPSSDEYCFLLVVSMEDFQVEAFLNDLVANCEMCAQIWQLSPLLIVTHSDCIKERDREIVFQKSPVPRSDIFFVENYRFQKDRSLRIDDTSRRILSAAQRKILTKRSAFSPFTGGTSELAAHKRSAEEASMNTFLVDLCSDYKKDCRELVEEVTKVNRGWRTAFERSAQRHLDSLSLSEVLCHEESLSKRHSDCYVALKQSAVVPSKFLSIPRIIRGQMSLSLPKDIEGNALTKFYSSFDDLCRARSTLSKKLCGSSKHFNVAKAKLAAAALWYSVAAIFLLMFLFNRTDASFEEDTSWISMSAMFVRQVSSDLLWPSEQNSWDRTITPFDLSFFDASGFTKILQDCSDQLIPDELFLVFLARFMCSLLLQAFAVLFCLLFLSFFVLSFVFAFIDSRFGCSFSNSLKESLPRMVPHGASCIAFMLKLYCLDCVAPALWRKSPSFSMLFVTAVFSLPIAKCLSVLRLDSLRARCCLEMSWKTFAPVRTSVEVGVHPLVNIMP